MLLHYDVHIFTQIILKRVEFYIDFNIRHFEQTAFKALQPSYKTWCLRRLLSFIQVMACRQFGTKPYINPC